jgi:hypothetical protein
MTWSDFGHEALAGSPSRRSGGGHTDSASRDLITFNVGWCSWCPRMIQPPGERLEERGSAEIGRATSRRSIDVRRVRRACGGAGLRSLLESALRVNLFRVEAILFLRHASGATHLLSKRKAAKLKRELADGRGGPEITNLVLNGYVGFLGPDGQDWDLEALTSESFK